MTLTLALLGFVLLLAGARQMWIMHLAGKAAREKMRADTERLAKEAHARGEKIFSEPDGDKHGVLGRMRRNRDG